MITVLSILKVNGRIKGYECTDGRNVRLVTKEQLGNYISQKKVSNATMQNYNGTLIIRCDEDVVIGDGVAVQRDKSEASGICVLSILKLNNRIKGYECAANNKVKILTKEQLANYINQKKVSNATMQMYNGTLIIRCKEVV